MRSLNQVMLIGHMAADVEFRQTKDGLSVATFPVATNRNVKTDGEKKEIADFHRVVAWGKLADICNEFLVKGMAVYISGRIINRSFDDKEGNRHYRTEIVAEKLNILTWKKSKAGKEELGIEDLDPEVAENAEEAVAA
jgi:single-strand DNA-binding protein